MTTINDVISTFDATGLQSAQGSEFDELVVDYLKLDPTLVSRYTNVSRSAEDISTHVVPLPATSNPEELAVRLSTAKWAGSLSAVVSTYQSIDVVSKAREVGAAGFDLILCVEAQPDLSSAFRKGES